MIDTFSRLSRHLLENLAFADYLSPLCLVKFMFPNIPCGTSRNSGRPASLCAMFDDDRSPLHVLHFWSFRIALYDECSPRVVFISVRCFMSKQILCLRILEYPDELSSVFLIFVIFSACFFEMVIPSGASCDSARTHPPFLASSRPPKNPRNEPCFVYYVKHINSIPKSSIFDPSRGAPFGPIFLE